MLYESLSNTHRSICRNFVEFFLNFYNFFFNGHDKTRQLMIEEKDESKNIVFSLKKPTEVDR